MILYKIAKFKLIIIAILTQVDIDNKVCSIEVINATKIDNLNLNFDERTDLFSLPIPFIKEYIKNIPVVRTRDSEGEMAEFLQAKYRFRNDESSTRFKITDEENKSKEDKVISGAFRAYAARRIVGGMETSISTYPYNVAMSRNGKHWCGGSLIDEQWVLTAGHCLEAAFDGVKSTLLPFIIRAGSSYHNRGGYQARVNKVFFPEKYSPGSADYDYSLARLDRPMPIGRNIAVLNLPSKDYMIENDDMLVVTGWGSTDETGFGHIPERMRFVPVPLMKMRECQKAYRFYITPRMLCAGYATGGKDACNHDSGGPAVRDGVLIGVVSFGGKRCGDPKSPGVYSRVSQITEWVETIVTNNEANTVPELIPKIARAREREKELQKFKARVEEKKKVIKNWLRETLNTPAFMELAKKKLNEAGLKFRRVKEDFEEPQITPTMNDEDIDEINLHNLITERIMMVDMQDSEAETLLHALALQEAVSFDDKNAKTEDVKKKDLQKVMSKADVIDYNVKTVIDYLKKNK